MQRPFSVSPDGIRVQIRLQPGASANKIDGLYDQGGGDSRIKIKVTAVPEKGKANKALLKLLTKFLHCPVRDMDVIIGQTDRNKTILVTAPADPVIDILEHWFADNS